VHDCTPDLSGKQVLIVEDNTINQIVLNKMLAPTGATLHSANDGLAALDFLAQHSVDLILMDCQMPNMDGYECTQQIRQGQHNQTDVLILAITANAFAEDKAKCLAAGMDDFIAKPINKIELYQCINNILHSDKATNRHA
jgi:two-component system, sensor histidine kinase